MRAVGAPNAALGIVPMDTFEEELEYKYLSQGFNVLATHYLGEVRSDSGGALGYKVMLVLQKEDAPKTASKQTLKDIGK